MDQKSLAALSVLLEDPDQNTFNAVMESLQHKDVVQDLDYLWKTSDNELVLDRLDQLMHKIRFNQIKEALVKWKQNGADIIEGAWLMATYQYPDIKLSDITAHIMQFVYDAYIRFNDDQKPEDKVAILNEVVLSKLKITTREFHHSFIHTTLDAKLGSDLMLAIIYMGVAQKLYLPIYGVPMPQIFLLAYVDSPTLNQGYASQKNVAFFINQIDHGTIYSEIRPLANQPNSLRPCSNEITLATLVRVFLSHYEKKNAIDKVNELQTLLQILGDWEFYID